MSRLRVLASLLAAVLGSADLAAAGLALGGRFSDRLDVLTHFAPAYLAVAILALALAVAAIWLVHPLQTESVTYIYQRLEALMGLFYLLTLYSFIRATDSPYPGAWYAASVAACAP